MKLCIVTTSVIKGDGQGRANYEIIWEAIRRGHQVTLLASQVDLELQKSDLVNWIPILLKGCPTQLLRNLFFSWKSADWLAEHRHEFDLVQVYGSITWARGDVNTAQFVHSGWLRSPVHISRQRRDLYGTYQWLYTALNAYWEKKAFLQARVVIAVSANIKQQLIDIGVPQERIQVIFNGVDVEEFSPGSVARSQLNLPEGVTLALFAGDIKTNRKNLDTVLSALVQVPELHLAVVGTTAKSPYPQLAETLGLSNRVHFLGYRNDISKIMQGVDLFVFPSRYEPFGMVVSEAMATGLPVITATTTGAAEIVTPDCGIVLPDSENIPALAQALSTLARDPELRHRMGIAGRAIAEQHSWTSKTKKYLDLFEELIES